MRYGRLYVICQANIRSCLEASAARGCCPQRVYKRALVKLHVEKQEAVRGLTQQIEALQAQVRMGDTKRDSLRQLLQAMQQELEPEAEVSGGHRDGCKPMWDQLQSCHALEGLQGLRPYMLA